MQPPRRQPITNTSIIAKSQAWGVDSENSKIVPPSGGKLSPGTKVISISGHTVAIEHDGRDRCNDDRVVGSKSPAGPPPRSALQQRKKHAQDQWTSSSTRASKTQKTRDKSASCAKTRKSARESIPAARPTTGSTSSSAASPAPPPLLTKVDVGKIFATVDKFCREHGISSRPATTAVSTKVVRPRDGEGGGCGRDGKAPASPESRRTPQAQAIDDDKGILHSEFMSRIDRLLPASRASSPPPSRKMHQQNPGASRSPSKQADGTSPRSLLAKSTSSVRITQDEIRDLRISTIHGSIDISEHHFSKSPESHAHLESIRGEDPESPPLSNGNGEGADLPSLTLAQYLNNPRPPIWDPSVFSVQEFLKTYIHEQTRRAAQRRRHLTRQLRFSVDMTFADTAHGQPIADSGAAASSSTHLTQSHVDLHGSAFFHSITSSHNHVLILAADPSERETIMILRKPPIQRTPKELKRLFGLMRPLQAFSDLSDFILGEVCGVMGYQYCAANRAVFRQGEAGTAWFIILSGSVSVQISKTGMIEDSVPVGVMRAGQGFGHLALVNDKPRSATILTNEACDLIVIEKHDYNRIIRFYHEKDLKEKVKFLLKNPLLNNWMVEGVRALARVITWRKVKVGTVIMKEGKFFFLSFQTVGYCAERWPTKVAHLGRRRELSFGFFKPDHLLSCLALHALVRNLDSLGDHIKEFFIVRKGTCAAYRNVTHNSETRQIKLGDLNPQDYFGEEAVFNLEQPIARCTVIASAGHVNEKPIIGPPREEQPLDETVTGGSIPTSRSQSASPTSKNMRNTYSAKELKDHHSRAKSAQQTPSGHPPKWVRKAVSASTTRSNNPHNHKRSPSGNPDPAQTNSSYAKTTSAAVPPTSPPIDDDTVELAVVATYEVRANIIHLLKPNKFGGIESPEQILKIENERRLQTQWEKFKLYTLDRIAKEKVCNPHARASEVLLCQKILAGELNVESENGTANPSFEIFADFDEVAFDGPHQQGSIDHRGVPEAPGRVVTLIPYTDWKNHFKHRDPHQQEETDICWGIVYKIPDSEVERVRDHLDFREKNGYSTFTADVYRPANGFHTMNGNATAGNANGTDEDVLVAKDALVYVATMDNPSFLGPTPILDDVALQIARAVGPSGLNSDYLVGLAQSMRIVAPHARDPHLYDLEKRVLEILLDETEDTPQNIHHKDSSRGRFSEEHLKQLQLVVKADHS
ncbi:hypothetical protein HK102_013256 [Quaeritorhiza haematococci]|nr:hypothetical protein HK102_013256 [Quaeritorhiza haematococci]